MWNLSFNKLFPDQQRLLGLLTQFVRMHHVPAPALYWVFAIMQYVRILIFYIFILIVLDIQDLISG